MITAFQSTAFQHNAFQTIYVPPVPPDLVFWKKRWWIYAKKQIGKSVIFKYYSRYRQQRVYPYYHPYNPRTPAQQANRNKFKAAMAAWKILPEEQKAVFEHRALGRHMCGKNIFVKEFMLAP
jgi:hypothetical protein